MTTINAELDICPSFGWQGGPEFNTMVKQLRNGHERRRSLWQEAKHHYILPFQNITNAAYLMELKSAFMAARGSAESFLVKDNSDYIADAESFGAGDGVETAFDLYIVRTFGSAYYARRILYPVDAVFYVDGVPVAATFFDGRVVFAVPPDDGAVLSWSGEFRVAVRFASDAFPMTIDDRSGADLMMNGSVELREVWE